MLKDIILNHDISPRELAIHLGLLPNYYDNMVGSYGSLGLLIDTINGIVHLSPRKINFCDVAYYICYELQPTSVNDERTRNRLLSILSNTSSYELNNLLNHLFTVTANGKDLSENEFSLLLSTLAIILENK